MAIRVEAFLQLPRDYKGHDVQIPCDHLSPTLSEATTATSVQFDLPDRARVLYCESDVLTYIAIGSDPVASSDGLRLKAGIPRYFGCRGGDKIAVING